MAQNNLILVGLGNPGKEYEGTYHNAGRMFLEYLASDANWQRPGRRSFEYAKGPSGIILVRPLSFMNQSGLAVISALRYFKAKTDDLLVLHDDSDLPLGQFKISSGQGPAGHRGVSSVIAALGTKDFRRVRIGVRTRNGRAGEFVLKTASTAETETLQLVFGDILKLMVKA